MTADPPHPIPIRVRGAGAADYPVLCRLWSELDRIHAAWHPDLFRVAPGAPRPPSLVTATRGGRPKPLRLLVAEAEQGGGARIVGLVQATIHDTPEDPILVPLRRGHISDLVVDPAWRGRGVGRALMDAACAWCREQGARQVVLTVWEGNREAEVFYRRLGYRPLSRVLGRDL